MTRAVLLACLPWLALLMASFCALVVLARLSRARLELGRLLKLHRDQVGSVQGLSFVLTLPLFIFVLMLIVQVSQLMIGQVVVEYAAIAAARAAVVWIPARIDQNETWNCVAGYDVDPDAESTLPSGIAPGSGGVTYKLAPAGDKYNKIRMAAALACLPIAPSRPWPDLPEPPTDVVRSLEAAYKAMAPDAAANPKTDDRLQNKLAYTLYQQDPTNPNPDTDTLTVDVRFYHSNEELPLTIPVNPVTGAIGVRPDLYEFAQGQELGWQDPITVTIKYKLALLPGPGRLLAAAQGNAAPIAGISGQEASDVMADTYTYQLTATATLGNEGEKPVYAHYNLPQYH